jgi:hypothetical protein
LLGEKLQQPGPPDITPDHRLAGLIDRMNGENSLGRVEGDALTH